MIVENGGSKRKQDRKMLAKNWLITGNEFSHTNLMRELTENPDNLKNV